MDRDPVARRVRHVGIIPDGGRRWAKFHHMALADAYIISMNKLDEYIDGMFTKGVEAVSVYLLSKYNLGRTSAELAAVEGAETLFMSKLVPRIASKHNVIVRCVGSIEIVPPLLRDASRALTEKYASGSRRLFLLVAYDPFDELLDAFQCGPIPTSREELLDRLWVDCSVDLVIRTGGAITLSNFLPLQSGYSRVVYWETLFNDTCFKDIEALIEDDEKKSLLFGK